MFEFCKCLNGDTSSVNVGVFIQLSRVIGYYASLHPHQAVSLM